MSRVPFRLTSRQDSVSSLNYPIRNSLCGALCLFAFSFVVGCANQSSFTRNQTDALPTLQRTQNPTPIDPANHVYGPTNTIALGQIYRPTNVIDPKTRPDQSDASKTTNSNIPN